MNLTLHRSKSVVLNFYIPGNVVHSFIFNYTLEMLINEILVIEIRVFK
jgi:hypothetical protein